MVYFASGAICGNNLRTDRECWGNGHRGQMRGFCVFKRFYQVRRPLKSETPSSLRGKAKTGCLHFLKNFGIKKTERGALLIPLDGGSILRQGLNTSESW